ncbi:MAG: DUF2062 domain-containing protein [Gammaproteobacteria bacterium]|jgi:uncharacterized protein|nr:DUF2062 domain-containing protein [Gammaproteobacteria bacterium]
MFSSWLQRLKPDTEKLRAHKSLRILGPALHDANLWHFNRRSARNAVAVGLFCAFLPIPFQMVVAAFLAISFHAYLPLSIALVWLTNPLTMPVIFYLCYRFGNFLLNLPVQEFAFEISWHWLIESIESVGIPFLTGCLVSGIISATLGAFLVHHGWRYMVAKRWRRRCKARQQSAQR